MFFRSGGDNINSPIPWICLQHQQHKDSHFILKEVIFKPLILDRHWTGHFVIQFILYVLYFLGLGLNLGTDYENKKKKLQQELQLDYKYFMATVWWLIWIQSLKHVSISRLWVAFSLLTIWSVNVFFQKKDLKTSEPPPQPQSLSLPIGEKIWVQVWDLMSLIWSLFICVCVSHKEVAENCLFLHIHDVTDMKC